ncbi:protein PHLOEM PROTEIN 2-LIKE A1 [Cocos nucifera]|uniref:Protein PHLOEM PROTEIN 2-LIKE A1 n=1 Tax=Cocos nucifera TaxID=13894 RepID=A0A8K0MXV3_COCNU|nr:protein PHLOEM PROTEIN 2-LIKE A1 [Cocos nucifera]
MSDQRHQQTGPHWRGGHEAVIDEEGHAKVAHFSARDLDITWGNDTRFWQWVGLKEDKPSALKFHEGAELIQVNWVEVKGTLAAEKLPLSTRYEVLYLVKFKDDAFGWHSSHITFQVTPPHGQKSKRTLVLEHHRKDCNKWHEIHAGEFSLTSGTGEVAFSMYGDDSEWWKGGMILGGVLIKPKLAQEHSSDKS